MYKILGDRWQCESNGQCSRGDNCSFRHDVNKLAKVTQRNPFPNSFMQQDERKASRTRSPSKDFFKGTCTNSFCKIWHPSVCLFYNTKSGSKFGEKCSYAHRQVDEQPGERSKTNGNKSAVAMLKKNDLHESIRQPVVNRDKSRRSGRRDVKRDTCDD